MKLTLQLKLVKPGQHILSTSAELSRLDVL
jgi:hypothetical protein